MEKFVRKMVLVRGNEVLKEFGTANTDPSTVVSKPRVNETNDNRKPVQSNRFTKKMVLVRGNDVVAEFKTNPVKHEVDRNGKQHQPKRNDINLNIPKPPAFKFVPKKEEDVPVDAVEEQIEKENEEMEQLQSSYEEVEHEEKSEAEKFIEDVLDDTDTVKEQHEEEDTAEDAERFPEPELDIKEPEEVVEELPEVEADAPETNQISEEAGETELDKLVHSLSVDEVEEKILKHFASLLTLGSKIQAIDDMLKPYVYQKFPNTAQDVYLKYMNAVNRISHFVEGEKAKVMDPIQVQSSVEEKPIDIYEEYFPIIEGWFASDLDPRGSLPNIEPGTGFVSFDMICKGLKETASSFITGELDEKGYSLPEDFDMIIDKIVQHAVNAHIDYIQKWADDVK